MSPEEGGGDHAPEPDDVPGGPRPDPLDRPWVHPSELSSFVPTPVPTREARPREWAIGIGSAAAAVLVTVLVLVAFGSLGGRHRAAIPPPVVTNPNDVIDYALARRVAEAVRPSIVMVRTGGDTQRPVGSGVVLQSNRVITTAHLLTGATKVDVVTDDGDELGAKVVGSDPQTDLALLEVTGGRLSLAHLASSAPVKVGQPIVAVAATVGSYTLGINVVSDRNLMVDTGTGVPVAGLIETGIATKPEMAGGALVDANGYVVGILCAAPSGDRGSLAVPISAVRDVQDQLDTSGKVSHGWLGVFYGDDATDPPTGGARLRDVVPDSPAAKAGLKPNDVVTRAGGEAVHGKADLAAATRSLRPQDPLDLTYLRDGQTQNVKVTLGAGDPALLAQWSGMMG